MDCIGISARVWVWFLLVIRLSLFRLSCQLFISRCAVCSAFARVLFVLALARLFINNNNRFRYRYEKKQADSNTFFVCTFASIVLGWVDLSKTGDVHCDFVPLMWTAFFSFIRFVFYHSMFWTTIKIVFVCVHHFDIFCVAVFHMCAHFEIYRSQ